MTQREDTALIAGQLADLTEAVKAMADQLISIRERADTQQGRIDLAARELTEVSSRCSLPRTPFESHCDVQAGRVLPQSDPLR